MACYPSRLADRASERGVFSKLTTQRRHSHRCLGLTSGGKWSFLENVILCVCVCALTCDCDCVLAHIQPTEERVDRLTHSLDNQQQRLCFRQRPPTVYPLSPETSSPLRGATSPNLLWALNRLCPPVHLLVLGGGLPPGIVLEGKVAA